jgi:hypothetical protein
LGVIVIADLDTLLIAGYVELTDWIIPSLGFTRRGPGKPPELADAELVCPALAQVLLRHDDERHWLRAAPNRIGHLFPRLLEQSEYNERVKATAPQPDADAKAILLLPPGRDCAWTPLPTPWVTCRPASGRSNRRPAPRRPPPLGAGSSLPARQPVTLTFSARGPFWPWVMSNSTFCPSSGLR